MSQRKVKDVALLESSLKVGDEENDKEKQKEMERHSAKLIDIDQEATIDAKY